MELSAGTQGMQGREYPAWGRWRCSPRAPHVLPGLFPAVGQGLPLHTWGSLDVQLCPEPWRGVPKLLLFPLLPPRCPSVVILPGLKEEERQGLAGKRGELC